MFADQNVAIYKDMDYNSRFKLDAKIASVTWLDDNSDVFYQQNEWCEFCYYASPLMGKDDRSAFHTNVFSRITILFVEGRKPLKIEQACKSILCIVAREDPNGYEITVAQEKQRLEEYENGGRVIFDLPAEGFVVPSYQMRYFMAALMVECNRAARFSKSSFEESKQKMNSLLEKLKPAK